MLQAAKTTEKDVVYDLGAGDGKIPIAAARDFKARAVGIEYNPDMAALAARNAQRAGVADKVKIIAGDIFENDFSEATVVTLYLLPDLNYKLRPHDPQDEARHARGLASVQHARLGARRDSPRVPPRRVPVDRAGAGRRTLDLRGRARANGSGTADLTQAFQRVGGTLTVTGKTQPLLSPALSGADFSFSFVDADGAVALDSRQGRRRQVRRLDALRHLRHQGDGPALGAGHGEVAAATTGAGPPN